MFRASVARAAAVAVAAPRVAVAAVGRVAVQRTVLSSTPLRLAAGAPRPAVAVAVAPLRFYSAAAGLNKEEVEGRIVSLLQGFDKVNDASNIKATSHFANDLGLDSLDTVEVVMAIEEEFSIEIPDKDADSLHSVDKAVEYILNQPDAH
ncbi:NADH dehydrogenase (ubiquinone) 1 alpha/beta subcomplex 1 [Sporothrix brasiliensis 5110]|uniref:Acyl carrier protein n=1 Tax=Sporothrix brasiliensis 5110 TaxID=1398154 RepID=A0A0C2FQP9_9PEZI|nr:NADH dehydrogenase (ubiquinone) 1 alpha/beta subcomplex 1 [Sporothrix brasiliensis 5110]KIH93373.1 NADH dehydrogenase (ubiquinone) 1 alpha/beta subcomplex 1 [Sporothrix brasiliensis 5110]